MVNYKEFNLTELGNHIVLGLVILGMVLLFMLVFVPILAKVHIVFLGFGLDETLLLFILMKLLAK